MPSGDTLVVFTPHANEPPATNYATIDLRNAQLVLSFDADTAQSAIFSSIMPRHYASGGITLNLSWLGVAVAGAVKWNAQFERQQTGVDDLDADSFATAQTATSTTAGTSGVLTITSIAFTSGAQLDSVTAGDSFRIKVTRDAADAADTMLGAAQLLRVELRET